MYESVNRTGVCFVDKREPNSQWKHGDPRAVQPGRRMVSRGGGFATLPQV